MSALSGGGSPPSTSQKLTPTRAPKSLRPSPTPSHSGDSPGRLSSALSAIKNFSFSPKSREQEGDAHSIADTFTSGNSIFSSISQASVRDRWLGSKESLPAQGEYDLSLLPEHIDQVDIDEQVKRHTEHLPQEKLRRVSSFSNDPVKYKQLQEVQQLCGLLDQNPNTNSGVPKNFLMKVAHRMARMIVAPSSSSEANEPTVATVAGVHYVASDLRDRGIEVGYHSLTRFLQQGNRKTDRVRSMIDQLNNSEADNMNNGIYFDSRSIQKGAPIILKTRYSSDEKVQTLSLPLFYKDGTPYIGTLVSKTNPLNKKLPAQPKEGSKSSMKRAAKLAEAAEKKAVKAKSRGESSSTNVSRFSWKTPAPLTQVLTEENKPSADHLILLGQNFAEVQEKYGFNPIGKVPPERLATLQQALKAESKLPE